MYAPRLLPLLTPFLLASVLPAQQFVRPDYSYGALGHRLGMGGVVELDNGRLALASGTDTFALPDYWTAQEWDALADAYRTAYTSPKGQQPIQFLRHARNAAGADALLVVRVLGRMQLIDPDTFEEVRSFPSRNDLVDVRVLDVDGVAGDEIVVKRASSVEVFNADGVMQRSYAGIPGNRIQVGQMDGDTALEFCTDLGRVYDFASGALQHDFGFGLGTTFLAADVDDDGQAELLSNPDSELRAYDADGSMLWSLLPIYSNGRMCVADFDDDGKLELAYGSVKLLIYELDTLQQSWSLYPADGGYSALLARDADGDGRTELVATGGYDHTGADHLVLYDTVAQTREWSSVHLDGPFLGPRLADLDGDGVEEVVTVTTKSDSGYANGRVLILSAADLSEIALSEPFGAFPGYGASGIGAVEVADLDGDGRDEIVLAGQSGTYDAVVRCLNWSPSAGFQVAWDSPQLSGMNYNSLAIGDADGDGVPEIFAGCGRVHTGGADPVVRSFDGLTGVELWVSAPMGGYWDPVPRLAFADKPADHPIGGVALLGCVRADGRFRVLNAANGQQVGSDAGRYVDVENSGNPQAQQFLLLTYDGILLQWDEGGSTDLGHLRGDGFSGIARPTPWSLVYGDQGHGVLYDRNLGAFRWETRDFGGPAGDEAVYSAVHNMIYGCGEYGVFAFRMP